MFTNVTAERLTGRRLPPAKRAKTNGMWSRVLDKNSTSFAQECTVRLFLEVERSAGAAATSGVGLPGPATDHRNSFSSWRYLATWRVFLPHLLYLPDRRRMPCFSIFFIIFSQVSAGTLYPTYPFIVSLGWTGQVYHI